MAKLKLASWNIFYSFEIYRIRNGVLEINPKKSKTTGQTATTRKKREPNIVRIIKELDAALLGIQECMPAQELELFQRRFFPKLRSLTEGSGSSFHVGLLYDPSRVDVRRVKYDDRGWKTKLQEDRKDKTYRWVRKPVIVKVTPKGKSSGFLLAVVHSKSKRKGKNDPRSKDFSNRKQIVAEGMRLRELMQGIAARPSNAKHREFLVIGDINDGPGFDRFEKRLNVSGLEAHLGNVLEPDDILHSFNDLSNGGERTTSFKSGQQIDHILMTRSIRKGAGAIKMLPGSGRVRSDLVDIEKDGKWRDSDHAPVEVFLDL